MRTLSKALKMNFIVKRRLIKRPATGPIVLVIRPKDSKRIAIQATVLINPTSVTQVNDGGFNASVKL